MKKYNDLTDRLNALGNIYDQVKDRGMSKSTYREIKTTTSLECNLPYPENAYSEVPSKVHQQVSMESIMSMIIDLILKGIDALINLADRIYVSFSKLFNKNVEKDIKKQKEANKQIKKNVEKAENEAKRKQKKAEFKKAIDDDLVPELKEAKERLNASYTDLIRIIDTETAAARYFIPKLHLVDDMNYSLKTLNAEVTETLLSFKSLRNYSTREKQSTARIQKMFNVFHEKCLALNKELAEADFGTKEMPRLNLSNHDYYYNPALYLLDYVSKIRELQYREHEMDYVDVVMKEQSAAERISRYLDELNGLFKSDNLLKNYEIFRKQRDDLKSVRKEIQKKGMIQEKIPENQKLLAEYIKIVSIVTAYAVRLRQVPKILVSACLRFLNCETMYLKRKEDLYKKL